MTWTIGRDGDEIAYGREREITVRMTRYTDGNGRWAYTVGDACNRNVNARFVSGPDGEQEYTTAEPVVSVREHRPWWSRTTPIGVILRVRHGAEEVIIGMDGVSLTDLGAALAEALEAEAQHLDREAEAQYLDRSGR